MLGEIAALVQKGALLTGCLFLAFVAWEDFRKFRVRNRSVLILMAIYVVFAVARGSFGPLVLDLAGGLLLFALGFAFWLLRMIGAGDAKLFFAVGCWVSLPNLAEWSILLLIWSIVLWALVKIPFPLAVRHLAVVARLDDFRKSKRVPYAVPISIATLFALLPNLVAV